ncbi:hypothetical protein ACH5RR_030255 [Cinchona calisaya]|uniref:HTH myb-type domain-containing protein n=1 Tax=Cinchona calisaya TaxID=153742 RepID=A0ABD2YU20_9GENT
MNMINYHTNSNGINYNEKMQKTQEYIDALQEERKKILVFQRELPLCLDLVTQAIVACKQQLSTGTTTITEYNFHGQSECSEQTSTEGGPVLEEFIPIKRSALSSDEDEQQSHKSKKSNITNNGNHDKQAASSSKKSDWLRSVQLWNQTTPDPPQKEDSPKKVSVVEVKRNGSNNGAFHPFKKEKINAPKSEVAKGGGDRTSIPVAEASSTAETGGGGGNVGSNKKEENKEGPSSQRKSRRCWAPELHKRFLLALQQLGGAHVATPKQIREIMKVDGLTNDEVKSHLQKYRLHNRRPSHSIHSNNNPPAPQFVVVGGIWVPPPEYAALAVTTGSGEASGGANSNGIYAPIPTLPPPFQNRGSQSGGGVHSNSPSTSSSADTATTSPKY